ncbi:RNA polymerase ECF-type sigma factor [Arcticibacter svalbardensis MN12-7]|uniref:RNA polymerase ECF-type sigma factor n=1 Tax=Arcticibacter svalbardensis MN12-7 TaxID=1150600 RepID=R9GQN8_9SPHI|nr:sigma-70 family RNA polymerase sigma factor [Arcticibacter svalbardensis]EOR93860.1 RNA polymerase ECF-type sigma factor [Arcticibacter svalbardensis MN12-7]
MIELSDKELLLRLSLGDEQAFKTLFDRYWKSLFTFVYRFTKNETETKDIIQDVFLYVWNNKDTIYVKDSLLPYLKTVARNNVMTAFRKDKIRLEGVDILVERIETYTASDDQLLYKEAKKTVDSELSKMHFNMRSCFQLSRFEDKSIREISKELQLSEQTVRNNISEALRRLRICIHHSSSINLYLLLAFMMFKS